MTIVDQYITDNVQYYPVAHIANKLGVDPAMVRSRIKLLVPEPSIYTPPATIDKEMTALLRLIENRKTGWAVDVAKQRLRELQDYINKT